MTTTNERDELADLYADILFRRHGIETSQSKDVADELMEAGYRKPRVIETAAELDALPIGSVILDADGDIHQNVSEDAAPHFDDRPHRWNSGSGWYDSEAVLTFAPLTLLHEGAA